MLTIDRWREVFGLLLVSTVLLLGAVYGFKALLFNEPILVLCFENPLVPLISCNQNPVIYKHVSLLTLQIIG